MHILAQQILPMVVREIFPGHWLILLKQVRSSLNYQVHLQRLQRHQLKLKLVVALQLARFQLL